MRTEIVQDDGYDFNKALKEAKKHPAYWSESVVILLEELFDADEVVFSGGPLMQHDAKEPRYEFCIAGPSRIVDALSYAIAEGMMSERREGGEG